MSLLYHLVDIIRDIFSFINTVSWELLVFITTTLLIVLVCYLEDKRMSKKIKQVHLDDVLILFECPICGSTGGVSTNKKLPVGQCLQKYNDPNKVVCFVCNWEGNVEDATITSIGNVNSKH